MVAKFLRFPLCGHGVSGDWRGMLRAVIIQQVGRYPILRDCSTWSGEWSDWPMMMMMVMALECNGNIFKVALTAAAPQHFENAHEQEWASWMDWCPVNTILVVYRQHQSRTMSNIRWWACVVVPTQSVWLQYLQIITSDTAESRTTQHFDLMTATGGDLMDNQSSGGKRVLGNGYSI